jgi:hypothetical protein
MKGSAELSYINFFRRFYRRKLRRLLRRWFWRKHRHVTVRICHFKSLGESVGNLNGEPVTSLYGHCTGSRFWIRRKTKTRQNLHVSDPPFFKFGNFSVRNSVGNFPSVFTDWITDGKVFIGCYRLNYGRKLAVGNFDLKIPTENIPSVNPLVFSEFLVVSFHPIQAQVKKYINLVIMFFNIKILIANKKFNIYLFNKINKKSYTRITIYKKKAINTN